MHLMVSARLFRQLAVLPPPVLLCPLGSKVPLPSPSPASAAIKRFFTKKERKLEETFSPPVHPSPNQRPQTD